MKLTCQFRRFLARTFIPVSFLGPKWLMGCSPSASLVIGRVFETQERKKVILFCSGVEDFAVLGTPVPKESFHYSGPLPMRSNDFWTCPDTEPLGFAPGCQQRSLLGPFEEEE